MHRLVRKAGAVVAADGGANVARRHAITPDVIIGDLDSITEATRKYFRSSAVLRVHRQDNTDLEKALDFIVGQGFKHATIVGATGKRLDFTLGNLSVIWRYTSRLQLECVGDGWTAVPVVGHLTMEAEPGTAVSVIPFGSCSGVTLRGLRYPLTNADMRVGQIGVSNVVRSCPFRISVRRGKLLLIVFDRPTRA